MKNLYPHLYEFFAGYFHQDWLEDSAIAADVVKAYKCEASLEEVSRTVKELHGLLAETPAEGNLISVVSGLGSYYNPQADGLSYRDWLLQVCALLEERSR